MSAYDLSSNGNATVRELQSIIRGSDGLTYEPSRAYDEVYDNIYVGDMSAALNKQLLQKLKVKYVLNVASGEIPTVEHYYDDMGINYLGLPIDDYDDFQIQRYFDEASHFIDKALKYNDKVFVHCRAGISRSPTIVIAYLIQHKGLSVQQALKHVRQRREVCPNDGFLKCLSTLRKM